MVLPQEGVWSVVYFFSPFSSFFCVGMSTPAEQSSSASMGRGQQRIRAQGMRLKYLLTKSAVSAGLIVGIWMVGYYRFTVTWVILPSLVCVGVMEYRKSRRLAAGAKTSEQTLLGGVDELPSWVSTLAACYSHLRYYSTGYFGRRCQKPL